LDIRQELSCAPQLAGYPMQLVEPNTLEVVVKREQTVNGLFAELSVQGIEVLSMRNKQNRLEQLFMDLVDRSRITQAASS
jgi:ABC-2 type transport system ATP-binding protein